MIEYKKCELCEEDTKELLNFAESNGIIFFSTPFDNESVDFLKDINSNRQKNNYKNYICPNFNLVDSYFLSD